jgi:hypothetical protein
MPQHYLPRKDRELLAWTVNFLKYLYPSLSRFNFPADEYTNLVTLRDDFAQKLELAEEPATRTKTAVLAKNKARDALEKSLQQDAKEFLQFNRNVTDEDRDNLGLPIYKTTRTPAPVADEAPDVDVAAAPPGRIELHFFERGSRHKKGKPEGQHCVEIAWLLSDTPPTRWDELVHSVVDTNSPYTFVFEHDRRGKTIYFALRWENTRGEKGPWSEIMNAIIP